MCGASHFDETYETKEVGGLKLIYGGGKPQRGGTIFYEGSSPLWTPCFIEKK